MEVINKFLSNSTALNSYITLSSGQDPMVRLGRT